MSEFGDFLRKAGSVSEDLGRSFVTAALQTPLDGASQLINHIARHEIVPKVHIIDGPKNAKYGSAEWYAQQIGSGAGIAVDFVLLGLFCRGTLRGGAQLAEAAGLKPLLARTGLARVGTALMESSQVTKALLGGAAYEGVCQPVLPHEGNNFWRARFNHAASGGLTFATLALSSKYVGKWITPEKPGTLTAMLTGRPTIGIISGIPAGFVSAETSSMLAGRGAASPEELKRSIVSFMSVGGTLGLAHEGVARWGKAKTPEQNNNQEQKPTTPFDLDRTRPGWIQTIMSKLNLAEGLELPSMKDLVTAAASRNVDLKQADLSRQNLEGLRASTLEAPGANLNQSNLQRAYLWLNNLAGVTFRDADLRSSILRSNNLDRADFRNANLEGVDFDASRATGADFRGANLRNAKFTDVDLTGSDFTGADVTGADFSGAILEGVRGLTGR